MTALRPSAVGNALDIMGSFDHAPDEKEYFEFKDDEGKYNVSQKQDCIFNTIAMLKLF